jgi:hypothetical protein
MDPWRGEITNPLSLNRYVYALNNPVNYVDPTGLMVWRQVDDTNSIIRCPPFLKNIYLGFSYLYLEKYELADNALKTAVDLFKEDTRDWVIELKELISAIRMLAKNEPNKVSGKLEEFIQQTKTNINLK